MGEVKIDLTGQKFGRLTVIKRAGSTKNRVTEWLCRCDCGNEKVIRADRLQRGTTQSCGCFHREAVAERNKARSVHCGRYTRLYYIWQGLKGRCLNVNNPKYNSYGERGIVVCDEWKDSFEAFRMWAMANGYEDTLTIDRIDVNGNYEPSNCRWATNEEQQNNKRDNHVLTYNGETHTVSEWAKILKLKQQTLDRRLHRGWSVEKALTTPARKLQNKNPKKE